MTAPKRTFAQRNWSPIEALLANPDFQAALQTILGKSKAPFDDAKNKQVFAQALTVDAGMSVLPPRRIQPERISRAGPTWRSVKDFPARFRMYAAEVERLSSETWFSPRSWVTDDQEKEADFVRLPALIRNFADYVETRIQKVHKYYGLTYTGKYSPYVLSLMEFVKQWTGGYCDKEVCALLNAAANVMRVNIDFDVQALMDLRQRSRRQPT